MEFLNLNNEKINNKLLPSILTKKYHGKFEKVLFNNLKFFFFKKKRFFFYQKCTVIIILY